MSRTPRGRSLAIFIAALTIISAVPSIAAEFQASPAERPTVDELDRSTAESGLLTTLTDHRRIHVDAAELRSAATGEPIVLDLGYVTLAIATEYDPVRAPGFGAGRWDQNGTYHREFPPRPNTYGGHVLREGFPVDDSIVALILDDGNVRGFIRDGNVSYNLQRADFPVVDGRETVVYKNTDVAPWGMGSVDLDQPGGHTLEELAADIGALTVGSGQIRIGLFFDPEYEARFGGYFPAINRMEGDFFLMKSVFGNQFGYTFADSYIGLLSSQVLGTQTDASTVRGLFEDAINSFYPFLDDGEEFHLAHLWTYRDTTSPDGAVYGLAHQGGFATRGAYSLTQQKNENAPVYAPESNDNHRKWPITHENAHILDGNHCRAYYDAPFFGSWTKTIMGAWGLQDGCPDTPGFPYAYDYVDRFSNGEQSGKDNVPKMEGYASARLGPAPTPNAPTGPTTADANTALTFTIEQAQVISGSPGCEGSIDNWYRSYAQVDWGDGSGTGKPEVDDSYCGSRGYVHSYPNAGTYDVRVRVKMGYLHEWSAWSDPLQLTIACNTHDLGPNCDAPNSFADAVSVSPGTFDGFHPSGDTGDYYKFSVLTGSSISVSMTPPICVDYDLRLFNPSNTQVASSTLGSCNSESVSATNAVAGDWRIRVHPFGGANSPGAYSVTLTLTGPQPPTASITSPADGSTVSGMTTVSGSAQAFEGRSVQRVEYRIDSGAWQVATGTTAWSFSWNTVASGNGQHVVNARAWDGLQFTPTPDSRTYTVSNGGGGEIARHDGSIMSCCEFGGSGTFITFNGVSSGAPITVTYKYCYLGNSNGVDARIRTVFDGTTVDEFSFRNPYTGGGTCTDGNVGTYASRSFDVTSTGVSSSIRFDYSNGDWRVSIADIVVTGPGGGGFSQDFESSTSGWGSTGFWHLTTRRANSQTHAMWYGREDTLNYENGASNSGSLTSPTITVPSGSPQLRFQSWYQTEDTGTSWDTKIVRVSSDGGSSWTQIGQVSGTNNAWVQQTMSLASFAGQSVLVRFDFDTVDGSFNNFEGWYVDDVQVS